MTSAALYVRQSLDRSGEGAAVDRQEADCRALADKQGWTVARVYSDNDRSASSGVRPGFTELLDALRAGLHDVVVVWHTDRLYRRLRDLVDLVDIAEAHAIRIAAVKAGDLDLSTPSGRMTASMLGSAARYEIEQKGARQKAANRQRAATGAASWTRRPFGFDRDGREVVIVEDEALVIRRIADDLRSGSSVAAICRALDAEGITTSTGSTWTPTTLRRVMTNPRLAGRVTYNGEDMGRLAPAILTEEDFERVVGTLTDPNRRRAMSTTVRHLLSGILTCSDCSEPMMSGRSNAVTTYRCRTCHRSRRADLVEEVVEEVVIARLSRPDAADLLADDLDVTAERAKAVELRERRDAIAGLLADGLLSPTAAREQAKRLAGQITEVEQRVATATKGSPATPFVGAEDVRAAWVGASLADRRRVIRALLTVECLPAGKGKRFDPDDLRIEWRAGS